MYHVSLCAAPRQPSGHAFASSTPPLQSLSNPSHTSGPAGMHASVAADASVPVAPPFDAASRGPESFAPTLLVPALLPPVLLPVVLLPPASVALVPSEPPVTDAAASIGAHVPETQGGAPPPAPWVPPGEGPKRPLIWSDPLHAPM